MIKSCHSLISFFTFSTWVPLPVLLKSSGFIRMSRAHELILWSLRSINWLSAVTESGYTLFSIAVLRMERAVSDVACSSNASKSCCCPASCFYWLMDRGEVMYWTAFSQSCMSVVMSYWANSIIETRVLWKKVAMIDVRYGLIFQFSLFTNVSGLGIESNALGSIAL